MIFDSILTNLNLDVRVRLQVDVDEGIESAVDLDKFVVTIRLVGRTLVHVETNEASEYFKI
jgi:hypothetical protein